MQTLATAQMLVDHHSLPHVAAAAAIAVVGGYAGFHAVAQAREGAGGDRQVWVMLAVFAIGVGVWSAHFIAMMGFRPDAALGFRIDMTAASMAAALLAAAALVAASLSPRRGADVVGATAAAAGTVLMHAVGMAALENCLVDPGVAAHAAAFFGAAVGYGLALRIARRMGRARATGAAAAFTAGVCWLHFAALAGTTVRVAAAPEATALLRPQLEPLILLGAAVLSAAVVLTMHLQSRGERQRRLIAEAANCMAEGAAVLRADGSAAWVNPAMLRPTGAGDARAFDVGRLLDFLSSRDAPEACPVFGAALRDDLRAVLRDGRSFARELDVRCPRRGVAWVFDVTVGSVPRDAGGRRAMLILLRDVTDERAREARLAAARDEAEALSRAKSQLLAVASHEIRTPLNGMLGVATLLDARVTDDAGRAMLAALRHTTHRLDGVLRDVLEFAEGPARVRPAACAPGSVADALAARYAPLAAARGLGFAVEVDSALGDAIRCDREALTRALGRLVDNAVKFTDTGSVTVALRRGGWNDRPAVICEVRDSGPGIDEAVLEAALAGFAQADASTTRAHDGLGLGLALTRRAVAAMRGVLRVTSDGGGSCFSIVLPGATEAGRDAAFYGRDIA